MSYIQEFKENFKSHMLEGIPAPILEALEDDSTFLIMDQAKNTTKSGSTSRYLLNYLWENPEASALVLSKYKTYHVDTTIPMFEKVLQETIYNNFDSEAIVHKNIKNIKIKSGVSRQYIEFGDQKIKFGSFENYNSSAGANAGKKEFGFIWAEELKLQFDQNTISEKQQTSIWTTILTTILRGRKLKSKKVVLTMNNWTKNWIDKKYKDPFIDYDEAYETLEKQGYYLKRIPEYMDGKGLTILLAGSIIAQQYKSDEIIAIEEDMKETDPELYEASVLGLPFPDSANMQNRTIPSYWNIKRLSLEEGINLSATISFGLDWGKKDTTSLRTNGHTWNQKTRKIDKLILLEANEFNYRAELRKMKRNGITTFGIENNSELRFQLITDWIFGKYTKFKNIIDRHEKYWPLKLSIDNAEPIVIETLQKRFAELGIKWIKPVKSIKHRINLRQGENRRSRVEWWRMMFGSGRIYSCIVDDPLEEELERNYLTNSGERDETIPIDHTNAMEYAEAIYWDYYF